MIELNQVEKILRSNGASTDEVKRIVNYMQQRRLPLAAMAEVRRLIQVFREYYKEEKKNGQQKES